MIAHADLMMLARQQDRFPLIAEYLRDASAEVSFVREGETLSRTHIIVDTGKFPLVKIGVEGSSASLVERGFFSPTGIYDKTEWELTDSSDENTIRSLIYQGVARDAEAEAAGRAELSRRVAKREAADNEAAACRTAALEYEASKRLVAAWLMPRDERRWGPILQDLNVVLEVINRPADRSFIAKEAAYRRRYGGGRWTDPQFRWLADILDRTALALSDRP